MFASSATLLAKFPLALLVFPVALATRIESSCSTPEGMPSLALLTWNVDNLSVNDTEKTREIARVVDETGPDVIMLQEVESCFRLPGLKRGTEYKCVESQVNPKRGQSVGGVTLGNIIFFDAAKFKASRENRAAVEGEELDTLYRLSVCKRHSSAGGGVRFGNVSKDAVQGLGKRPKAGVDGLVEWYDPNTEKGVVSYGDGETSVFYRETSVFYRSDLQNLEDEFYLMPGIPVTFGHIHEKFTREGKVLYSRAKHIRVESVVREGEGCDVALDTKGLGLKQRHGKECSWAAAGKEHCRLEGDMLATNSVELEFTHESPDLFPTSFRMVNVHLFSGVARKNMNDHQRSAKRAFQFRSMLWRTMVWNHLDRKKGKRIPTTFYAGDFNTFTADHLKRVASSAQDYGMSLLCASDGVDCKDLTKDSGEVTQVGGSGKLDHVLLDRGASSSGDARFCVDTEVIKGIEAGSSDHFPVLTRVWGTNRVEKPDKAGQTLAAVMGWS